MTLMCITCLALLVAACIHFLLFKLKVFSLEKVVSQLLLTFLSTLLIAAALSFDRELLSLAQVLHLGVIYLPLMFTYIITWVALEGDSPSMSLARYLEIAEDKGRTREEINTLINEKALVLPRIQGMLDSGWIARKEGRYTITQKGQQYNRLFSSILFILNIQKQG